jgi:hypothetical protein
MYSAKKLSLTSILCLLNARLRLYTCSSAAKNGHLVVLQWLHANGCPWNESTCMYAAYGGHLAVLQWARANGCPWDWRVAFWAARNGHTALLDWVRANGCPEA